MADNMEQPIKLYHPCFAYEGAVDRFDLIIRDKLPPESNDSRHWQIFWERLVKTQAWQSTGYTNFSFLFKDDKRPEGTNWGSISKGPSGKTNPFKARQILFHYGLSILLHDQGTRMEVIMEDFCPVVRERELNELWTTPAPEDFPRADKDK